jgi:DNA-binding SARP family transcriptional activator
MEFRVLGPIEVSHNGRSARLGSAKERRLLALLLAQPSRVVPIERLIDDLWDHDAPESATLTLRVHVSRLRKAFTSIGADPDVIATRPGGYVLEVDEHTLDSIRFEGLVEQARSALADEQVEDAAHLLHTALALWRGPALAGAPNVEACRREAARLEEARLAALEDRVQVDLDRGLHASLVSELEGLTIDHPYRERLWGHRMLALYRSGRPAEALSAHAALRDRLVEELGIDPSPTLTRLAEAIRGHEPSLAWRAHQPAAAEPTKGASVAAPSPGGLLPPELSAFVDGPFVGRQDDLDHLLGAWRDARDGIRRGVLVAGEAGIGKTELARRLAGAALEAGGVVLYGRADPEAGVGYQAFAQAIRGYVAHCPVEELTDHVASFGSDLVRLVPFLAQRVPDLPPPAKSDPEIERLRLFESAVGLVASASQRAPVLLVLDDLHWAGPPTLLLLRHLLRAGFGLRLLVVANYRDTEVDQRHPIHEIATDLRRLPGVERMHLRGLTDPAMDEFVSSVLGEGVTGGPELVSALRDGSDGNPLFVRETLRHLTELGAIRNEGDAWIVDPGRLRDVGLPEGIRDVLSRRLARLSPEAQRTLMVAAVVGPTFSLRLLEQVDQTAEPERLLDALDEAVLSGMVVESGRAGEYAFAHALIRHTLDSGISASRRVRLHRLIGEAIERLPNGDEELDALAQHFAEAALDGQAAKAADYALAAARRSLDGLGYEAAISVLDRGLEALEAGPVDLARRADLQLALAEARLDIGDVAGWKEASSLAAADARALSSPARLARAAVLHTNHSVVGTPDPAASALCEEALGALGDADPALRAEVLAGLAYYRALSEGEGENAAELAAEALTLARAAGQYRTLALCLFVRSITLTATVQTLERVALADELLTLATEGGDLFNMAQAVRLRGPCRLEQGDLAGFQADLAELDGLARRLGAWFFTALAAEWKATDALLAGRWDEARLFSQELNAVGRGEPNFTNVHLAQMLLLSRETGNMAEWVPVLVPLAEANPGLPVLRTALGLAHLQAGDRDGSREQLEWLAKDGFSIPRDTAWVASITGLTELCAALGDAARAEELAARFQPWTGRMAVLGWGGSCLGAVDRFLGMLALTAGQPDDAVRLLRAGLEQELAMQAGPLAARTRLWLGRALRATGATGEADLVLTHARSSALSLGMSALVAEIE